MNFDSGWEWTYWLNDIITARASWDPLLHIDNIWDAFNKSLDPFVNLYPYQIEIPLRNVLINLTKLQDQLFIYGNIKIINKTQILTSNKLSGLAYLQGILIDILLIYIIVIIIN